jgi:ketosteroid isomerase-like protein
MAMVRLAEPSEGVQSTCPGRGVHMPEQDIRQAAEAVWRALAAGDWDGAAAYLHPDFVQEWPQSGERIVGADNALAIDRNFPGGMPSMNLRRVRAAGDLAVVEVELTYADGSTYLGLSLLEFRDGSIVKETDYFAEPFPAPQWRAQWVERT